MDKFKVSIDEDIRDLVPGYLENREKDLQSIKEWLASENFDQIKSLGHTMKGSGSGYGFDTITEIGKNIESAASAKNVSAIQGELDRLRNYLDNLEITYE